MEYEIDIQRAVVGNAGVLRARPKVSAWACSVTFEFEQDFLDPGLITSAFERAGKIAGVGDYRPACPKGAGGPYGRYTVASK